MHIKAANTHTAQTEYKRNASGIMPPKHFFFSVNMRTGSGQTMAGRASPHHRTCQRSL